ncbi:uncharacterized protein C8Q71DRAFT_808328 [Rhodofomes roseus]|uniref:Uncharacterized protein n=1 Tax=Rhodofomes roseus TaxID=34475 RepID=A0ABQ8KIL9_9APHY|nr:uncharacterized protein C8Q71DRAFT_808328 [Rhodofomes roseus]KAH9837799.1 hypothetical protein C8Q71DRAFT_808328 [Rhodofomes roseus]
MPGPRNMKKKAKQEAKKARRSLGGRPLDDEQDAPSGPPAQVAYADDHDAVYPPDNAQTVADVAYPYDQSEVAGAPQCDPPYYPIEAYPNDSPHTAPAPYGQPPIPIAHEEHENIHPSLVNEPFIYDPGNGPRVRNVPAFLASSFAAPPTLDDPLCAEFAQEEMLEMLFSVLPEETAMILWYNKSRIGARVCPACQRLYRLGDALPEHMLDEDSIPKPNEPIAPNLLREQELSGLCSPMCFVLAAFNYPGAIRSAWGRMAEELDAETWDLLDGPGTSAVQNDRGLGMLLKMTRCADLGLGEMFFPDEELPPEDDQGDYEEEYSDEEDYGVEVSRLVREPEKVSLPRLEGGLGVQPAEGELTRSVNVLSLTA